ncbi:G-protein coupled receptor 98 [Stylophora pistillata]|uniref:G-protein coupled receptor 98 n=1 Tax=Stylophora pistillata TaxID=50429 RepID=A0A2B4RM23_STYPI|nr:G-protein coupled receptor 98 [Stylophora pistillata]
MASMDTAEMNHLLALLVLFSSANGDGNFRFTNTHIELSEEPFTQASFGVSRTGSMTGTVILTCQMNASAQDDVDGLSQNVEFKPNQNSGSCVFTIVDDAIPEANETFSIDLTVGGGSGTVVSPSVAYLTILANDDAFGIIGFNETGPIVVDEVSAGENTKNIKLVRKAGLISSVQVSWRITSGPNSGSDDFTHTSGVVVFDANQYMANLSLLVKPDNVPENDETFTLVLESPTGGAVVETGADQITVTISANDAPLEFPIQQLTVPENQSTIDIEVHRGVADDGINRIGPVNEVATVEWYLAPGLAKPGKDYRDSRSTLTFQPGDTIKKITVQLIDDNVPEQAENFTFRLANASQNAYIKPPGIATVILLPNDDQHGVILFGDHPSSLDEDSAARVGMFYVNRSAGTFGEVTVSWKIHGDAVSSVFESTSGMITFSAGVSQSSFQVSVRLDSVPEEAKQFYVQLYNVTGGARLENALSAQRADFFVQDSDNVYGVFQFAGDNEQRLDMDSEPRHLLLNITRIGGLVGDVAVNVSVGYILPGSSSSSNDKEQEVTLTAGSSSVSVTGQIANDQFIKLGAAFKAELTGVALRGGASAIVDSVKPSSPKIGNRPMVYLNITAADANGEVGFSTVHQQVSVQEPAGPSSRFVHLLLKRTGTADRVVVYWNITSKSATFFANDTGPQSGNVTFEEGHDEVNVTIEIKPDSTPEVAETFTVNLVHVSNLDRLQTGASSAQVTIEDNDKPGGTFEFKNTSSLYLQEGDAFSVVIKRLGSALDTRWVEFKMVPSGADDFSGSVKLVRFLPGEREKSFAVIAKTDNVPEIDEKFLLGLFSEGPEGQKGVLGSHTTVNVTIKENDDPYGVVGFRAPSLIEIIDESKDNTESARFEVSRDKGTFGVVLVSWNITANNGGNPASDVSPVSGQVTFSAGENSKFITIESRLDNIPEGNESFTLRLDNISSIAKLASQDLLEATLIISKNDDPVYFAPPTSIQVQEGLYANLIIERGGDGNDAVDVFYQTIDGTATSSSGDYQSKTAKVTFDVGEFQKTISIMVSNDSTPEGVETFTVRLLNSTGDTVLYNKTAATVTILASDKGTGVFKFASSSLNKTTQENAAVEFTVEREFAQFGEVRVYWKVVRLYPNGTTMDLSSGQEFTDVVDFVTFANGESSQSVRLRPLQDRIAELDETFQLQLVNATAASFISDFFLGIQTGENGVISSPSKASLTVTTNDDPNGLMRFEKRSLDIPEDYNPGMKATTIKTVTVLRDQGSWGSIKVAWEIQTASASLISINDNAYDLFLLGSKMSGVDSRPDLRRLNTETYVYCFYGTNNESFVELSASTSPQSKFSVRFWVNATKGMYGYVLTSVDGNAVNFALALNTTGSTTMADFFYLSNKTEINLGKNIADNSWHFVVFTVDVNVVQFYVDGDPVGNAHPLPSGSLSANAVYRVGKGPTSESQFTGCIQDITEYREVIVARSVKEMANSNNELTPINGYLTFEPGVTQRTLTISTIDDNEPEDDTPYNVVLYSPLGGARLDTNEFWMDLKVLKSDNANGLFGLKSINPIVISESTNVTVTIERLKGRYGAATVYWSVFKNSSSVLASEDFIMASGSVNFAENEDEKVVIIPVNDDALPEVDEYFSLNLTSVSPTDGSTPTSAASLRPGFTQVDITIRENDYPNGLLQFMHAVPVANGPILPSSSQFNVDTRESAGTLTLHVIRAQGTLGSVKCQWKTIAGTAKTPEDYIGSTGAVEFGPGARNSTIDIRIVDNNISELNKTFRVELFSAEGGAELNPSAKIALVTILPSDDAFGIISYSPDSLNRSVREGSGSTVSLTVQRTRGVLGPSSVYWEVSRDGAVDVENTNGFVVLAKNSNSTQITIRIKEDAHPELAESFLVHLRNVSAGRLADHGTQSNVTILASDDPYGVFVFSPSQLTISESNTTVNLTIQRLSGVQGMVRVNYSSTNANRIPNVRMAVENDDYVPIVGSVVFSEGQMNASISLMVLDDNVPEDAETVMVNLTEVQLVSGHPVFPAPESSPRIGASRVAQVVIEKNDNANGIVQLSSSSVSVPEPYTGSVVNITRTAGAFGTIYVSFEVVALSANGSDYGIDSRNVTLVENQQEATVPVFVIHDLTPEFSETFQIKLTGVAGGAVLGTPVECTVTILENDYPFGLIGFENSSLSKSVKERDTTNTTTLQVIRTFGLRGGSRVHWKAFLNGVLARDDVEPVEGSLVFAQGENRKEITLNIKADAIPEISEVIDVNFTSVEFLSEGTPSLDEATRVAKVHIEPNDAPHGMIEFAQSSYNASEGRGASLLVLRQFGTTGDIRVFFSTVEHVGGTQARPNVDYIAVTNSSIVIPSGNDSANITITIPDDNQPELGEVFDVVLEHVELVGQPSPVFPPQLGGNQRAAVTIVMSDDAHGLIVIKALSSDQGTDGSRMTVNETENFLVHLVIERHKGTIGQISVKIEVLQNDASAGSDFIASEPIFTFADKDNSSQNYLLTIKDDNIPEIDEEFVIKLVNPTGGARVAPGLGNNVTIIIQANDGVAGQVGFDEQSRSVVAMEGSQVSLLVNRTRSNGRVSVDWLIAKANASSDFTDVSGTVVFNEGEKHKTIDLTVRNDSTPETNEVFVVQLSNIQTFGIASAGEASLITGKTTATISISASNRPHGVIELEAGSRFVSRSDERNFTLTVSRLFGDIGAVRVYYEAMHGNITALQSNQRLALPEEDFVSGRRSIVIGDGEDVGSIPVWIKDDEIPELGEVFLVNITAVELVNPSLWNNTIPPILGHHHVSEITLLPNDDPHGVFRFPKERVYVTESRNPFSLTVLRDKGTFGEAQVNYFVQTISASLNDFNITGWSGPEVTLVFPNGVSKQNITIYVADDSESEGEETLKIGLTRNTGDTKIGSPSVLDVVIVANDDAYGLFSLASSSLTISEPGTGPVTEAEFEIDRSGNTFGTVIVSWEILNVSASSDLSLVRGNVTFSDGDTRKTFKIKALLDSVPEKEETFVVKLTLPGNGRLVHPSEALLTVTENDSPYGELEIVSSTSMSSTVDIEEDHGIVKAKVIRSKGDFGRITVDYMTVSQTAGSLPGNVSYFEKVQQLKTVSAYSWHVFSAFGDVYALLASTNRTGSLPSAVDDIGRGEYFGSALFRWQGVLVPVQTIATDGAVAWDSMLVGDKVYLAVANYGNEGRYEVHSRIYTMDSTAKLTVLQNISTQGASDIKFFRPPGKTDIYLIVANQRNNAGQTRISSQVYKWQGGSFVLQSVNLDNTRSASGLAVFETAGTLKVAVAFFNDSANSQSFQTKSPIYEWNTISESFALLQEIDTSGPVGVEYFEHKGKHYLVFANSKASVDVYRWSSNRFVSEQELLADGVQSAKPYIMQGNAYLVTVESDERLNVYKWDDSSKFTLQRNTTLAHAQSAIPVVLNDPVAGEIPVYAVAVSGNGLSPLLHPVRLSPQADFIPRQGQLIFHNGQRELELDFTILPDTTPERDEAFTVHIYNASGKAIVNSLKQDLTVNILSNDDAHGRIGFAADSLTRVQPETAYDSLVTFEVIREYGSLGRVVAQWNVSGNFSDGDLSPFSGELVFEDGQTSQNISMTVHKDVVPELLEVAYIRLLRLTETGSSDANRGAVLNSARVVAMLVIPANDDPYGVIGWKNTLLISQEDGPKNITLSVDIMRWFGAIGDILVSYETVQVPTAKYSDDRVALAGVDYKTMSNTVEISAGRNSTQITLDIAHYNDTMLNSIFHVNITAVTLKQGVKFMNSPRIDPNSRFLEVVIAQPNRTVGELNFDLSVLLDPATKTIQLQEGVETLNITVQRTGSSSGNVGFRFIARPLSSSSYTAADNADFSPSEGTVMFTSGETRAILRINITNDNIPEIEESFFVQMSRPLGGVLIGGVSKVDVIIKPNDAPYGRFGFTKATSENINIVQEGSTLHLAVNRQAGAFGDVHVIWRLAPNAGIVNASSQISPMNGSLTFKQGVTSQFITLHARDDMVAEVGQTFTCELISVDNGGKLDSTLSQARVHIPANDEVEGIVSIDPKTRFLIAGEPMLGHDGVFVIRFLRRIGQSGNAQVTWSITANSPGDAPSPTTTFNVTSGTVEMPNGVTMVILPIMVKDDSTPEELAVYNFALTGSTQTSLDSSQSARRAQITVVASDDPYGIIEFQSASMLNVSEDVGFVNLTIVRNSGSIGELSVNYSVSSTTATKGSDYESFESVLKFADKEDQKTIHVLIKKDNIPELAETVTVELLSVELVSGSPKNYSTIDGLPLNTAPRISPAKDKVMVVIAENDDARGNIRFTQSSQLVREKSGAAVLELVREGGNLGAVEVAFSVRNGTAFLGEDFKEAGGIARFSDGQTSTFINVTIIDDAVPEQRDYFTVRLDSVTGGAKLESPTTVTVTIETSDDPGGLFGFVNSSVLSLVNPSQSKDFNFVIQREGGAEGEVEVSWKVIRIHPPCVSCSVRNDFEGPTAGSSVFPDQAVGATKTVRLRVRPYLGFDEPEERFILSIYKVSGNGTIDGLTSNITIIIAKHGFPNGVFGFQSTTTRAFDEPATGVETPQFTVERTNGTQGTVNVIWQITSPIGSPGSRDISSTSGSVTFNPGDFLKNILVEITADDVPELEAVYTLSILSVDGGADLSPSPRNVTFKIRPNDDPHGIFKLQQGAQKIHVSGNSRQLQFSVVREKGTFGAVDVQYEVQHSDGLPADAQGSITVPDKQNQGSASVALTTFLALGSTFTITLTGVRYSDGQVPATSIAPKLSSNSPSDTNETVVVPEDAANAVFKFADESLRLTVDAGDSVPSIKVIRTGLFGSATVDVRSGFPSKSFDGFAAGKVLPASQLLSFTGSKKEDSFSVQVYPVLVPDKKLVYSVYLASAKTPNAVPGGAAVMFGASQTALIEYSGVVQVAPDSQHLATSEGGKAEDPIPANGQVRKVQLEIKDDELPEPEEQILVYLTDATGGARVATDSDIGLQSWATITVEGNDLMNGEIGFVPGSQSATVDEDGPRRSATLKVQRSKATFGEVQVSWSVRESEFRDQVEASEGRVKFASGAQQQDLVVTLKNDAIPERASKFHVDLNGIVSGSQARINPQFRSAVINVLESDYPNGTVAFHKDTVYTTVDKSATEISLQVIRDHGKDNDVTVYFKTRDLPDRFTSKPGLETSQALAGQDYEKPTATSIRFAKGETSQLITIALTPREASPTKYPKAFEVVLLNATGGAKILNDSTSLVTISDDKETTTFLKLRALAIQTPLSDDKIDEIFTDLKSNIQTTLDEDRLTLTMDTINIILSDKKSQGTALRDSSKQLLMDIFDELLNPSRDDTRGQDKLSTVFETFAFSLMYALPCPDENGASLQGQRATVKGFRRLPSQLNGLKIVAGRGEDYFQYPSRMFSSSSSSSSECNDVHFIDYQTAHWFNKPNKPPVINEKVLSTSLNETPSISSQNPVTYRIYTNKKRVTPKGADCVFWDHSKSAWSTEGCIKKNDKAEYVECQCDHLSIFAAQGESDDRTGYKIYFFIVCFVCMGAFFVALVVHHACSVENMFAAKLLMHLFFACMMAQLMYVLGAYLSPELVDEPTRCSVLAVFIHYFFLCQFSLMFIEGWNLWRVFVLNDEHTDRKLVMFCGVGWGMPVVLIVIYILVTQLGLNWEFTVAYADVHSNGDMCFIPNAYAALASVVGPVLLLLTGVALIFTQAYLVTPQWKHYDDIFRGHYNIKEIRWALYVLIWYCLMRNQLRGVFKRSFAFPSMSPPIELREDLFRDSPGSPQQSIASLKRSGMRNSPDEPVYLTRIERRSGSVVGYPIARVVADWDDLDYGATPKGSRKMFVNLDDTESLGRVNEMYEDDDDTQDFDDLIFALKTGGHFEPTLDEEKDLDLGDQGDEQYAMRRISIADTHL